MAAGLSELFHNDLAKHPDLASMMSISVHDIAPQILALFEKKLSKYTTASLRDHRVQIKVNSPITTVTEKYNETKEDGQIAYGI